MSLLLDALKQAERNKAQSGEQASTPALGDPRIRLDSIDLDLREPSTDKVEPYVADGAAPSARAVDTKMSAKASTKLSALAPERAQEPGAAALRSTVARAMQEPGMRAGSRYAIEQEVERQQSAKQLFAAKQSAHKPPLSGTWIAGIAVAALAIASGLIYFWTMQRGEQVAATPLPPAPIASTAPAAGQAASPPAQSQSAALPPEPQSPSALSATPAAAPAPAASATSPPGSDSASASLNNSAAPEDRPALGAASAQPLSPEAAASGAPPATPGPAPTQSAGEPQNSATGAATTPAQSDATSDSAQSGSSEVAAADDSEEEAPLQFAEAKPLNKKASKTKRKAQTNDTWVLQPDAREPADAAPAPSTRGARKPAASATESSLSVQRSAPGEELHPDLAAAYQALISGNATAAAQRYQAVLKSDAFNLDAELGLATIAASRGDRESARRHYRRALELDPKNDVALAGLAGLAAASGSSSESGLKTQLTEQPTSHHLHFALGNDFARQGRWPQAQQAYFNAYSLDPDNPDYAYNLAVSLDHLNQPRPALSYYQRARQLSEARAAQFNRAQLEQRISDLKQP